MADRNGYPALVGRKEAAAILGVRPENMSSEGHWTLGLPPSLQERGIRGMAVSQTPLWPRAEIVALARRRRERAQRRERRAARAHA